MAGQLIRRGDRTWMVRIFLGRDPLTGKRKYHNKTVHGSRRDAQRYVNGVLRDMDLGKFCPPKKIALDKFLDQWLEKKVKPRVRDSTFRSYEQLMRCYVRPGLGSKMISKITGEDVQELYLAMAGKGLAASTIQKVHTVLGSAFRQAVKWGTLGVNPAAEVEVPKDRSTRREERIKILPLDRVQEFLDYARCSRWGVLWAVALGTGMRPSEYLALKWDDLDVDQGLVRVRRTLYRPRDGGWNFQPPKTKGSVRSIALPEQLVEDLLEHKEEQVRRYGELHEIIFSTKGGEPLFCSNLRRRGLKPLLRELGIDESIHLYALRHTHATMLLSAGVHPKIVAERLGHSSVRMTLDVYSHVVPTMQREVAGQVGRLLYSSESE